MQLPYSIYKSYWQTGFQSDLPEETFNLPSGNVLFIVYFSLDTR